MQKSHGIIFLTVLLAGIAWTNASTNPSSSRFFNRKLLKRIKSYVDPEVSACEDLYQHACGKFPKVMLDEENNGYEVESAVGKVNAEIDDELSIYMNVMSLRNKPDHVIKASAFYKSCLEVDEYDNMQFLSWMEENENLTWALKTPSSEMSDHKFNWVETLGVFRKYGLNGILIEEDTYVRYDDSMDSVIDLYKPVQSDGIKFTRRSDRYRTVVVGNKRFRGASPEVG